MIQRDTIKYIKNYYKNIHDEEIIYMERTIAINLNKKYKLKNPILHEHCIINTLERLNNILSVEKSEYASNTEDNYILTLDNIYFTESILIDENERILPIRVMKANGIINKDSLMINIIDVKKNNYCG